MSQSLNKVKKRIATVQATQKLTGAMKLVSSVKYSKLSKEILNRQDYYFYLNDLASTYFSAAKINNLDIPYIKKNLNTKKRLLVVVSSSMGENLNINTSFADILDNLSISSVRILSNYLISKFLDKEYREIVLLYTKFQNSISFIPKKVSLLPVAFKFDKKRGLNPGDFEPNLVSFSNEFIRLYLMTDLYFKIYESYLSEVASRRNAMDNADKNAKDLIDKLTLEFNKARQASITQELTEVVNGSMNK